MEYLALALLGLLLLLRAAARRRPARPYELVHSVGQGDLSEVHGAVRDGGRFLVKVPRVGDRMDLPARELEALTDLRRRAGESLYAAYLPCPVESFEQEGRRVNVFRWRDGFRTAEEIRGRFPSGLDGRHLAWMFKRTLEILGFVHRAGWVHGAVLPPHLLFHPEEHALMLVGWIHAERPGRPLRAVPARFEDWYPSEPLTPSTDLYLAARSMIYLAGGDPVRGQAPKSVPREIRRFLEACLLESASMRCPDAWQLHEEFTRMLEGVYGPPAFHPLVLS